MVKRDHELDNTGRIARAREAKEVARRSENHVAYFQTNADELDFPELNR